MRTAYYNGVEYPIDDDTMSVTEIKDALAAVEPSIRNAEGRTEGDRVYFAVKAATKG